MLTKILKVMKKKPFNSLRVCNSQYAVLLFLLMQGIVLKTNAQDAKNLLAKTDQQFFIENKGQWPKEVLYLTKQNGLNAWITKSGVVYDFYELELGDAPKSEERNSIVNKNKKIIGSKGQVVKMSLLNTNSSIENNGEQKSEAYHNYFLGNDKTKWASNVGLYKEAKLKNIYDNIDERFYFDNGNIRYDYIVKPTGNVNDIKLNIEGANETSINREGELVFITRFGEVKQAQLFTYQLIDNKKVKVASSFKLLENGIVGFEFGEYDKNKELVIDPLIYSTYIGSLSTESSSDIKVNSNGEAYITGGTHYFGFPTTTGAYNNNGNGMNSGNATSNANLISDVIVTKINASGSGLIYSTFIGGAEDDYGTAIDIDNSGNAYITGFTNHSIIPLTPNFPTTIGCFNSTKTGIFQSTFVTKLNSTGTALVYSTYLWGLNMNNNSTEIKVDNSGNAFVLGTFALTPINNIPTGTTYYGGTTNCKTYQVQLNNTGTGLNYSHLIDGNCIGLALVNNNVYVTGKTSSNQVSLFRFNTITNLMTIGSLIGGLFDYGVAVDVNSVGEVFVTGVKESNVLFNPACTPINTPNPGSTDIFVTKYDNNLNPLCTRILGGSLEDISTDIKIGTNDNINIVGLTKSSTNFYPTPNNTFLGGLEDAFYIQLDQNLVTLNAQFIGGSNDERASGIDVLGSNDIFITGKTLSTDYFTTSPDINGPYQPNLSGIGSTDIFVWKYKDCSLSQTIYIIGSNDNCLDNILTANPTPTGTYTYQWDGPNGFNQTTQSTTAIGYGANPLQAIQASGIYTVTVTNPQGGCTASALYCVTSPPQGLTASASISTIYCNSNTNVTLSASQQWPNASTIPFFTIDYIWTGGGLLSNTFGQSINVTPTTTTTYTVTAYISVLNVNDGQYYHGCSSAETITVIVDNTSPFCCNPSLIQDPTVIKVDNQSIANSLGNPVVGKTFFVNGTTSIPANRTFTNCTFYFTANSKIDVQNSILTLNNCTLQSPVGCEMWDGIYADNSSEQIIINNSSISDMINGVVLKNDAKTNILGSTFTNNRIAMQLENMPFTPSIAIKNNTITAPTLKVPYLAQIGEHGIKITNCPNITIGGNSNEKNHFENLYNGIYISQQYSATVVSTITTSYNTFKNITGGQTILPGSIQQWPPIPFNTQHRGNAIFGYNNNASYTAKLIHFGNNISSLNDFDNCQRAAVVTSFSTDINNNYVENGEAGFMHYTCENQIQELESNHIYNVYLGISTNGKSNGGGGINYNTIYLLQAPISGPSPWFQYVSKGIDVNFYIPLASAGALGAYMQIGNNTIFTFANDFVWGISYNNVSHTHTFNNYITFNGGASATTGLPTLRGLNIGIGNALNAHLDFKGNKFNGTYSAANLATRSTGIFINRTTNANITCNEFNNLREGMNVVGNCQIDGIYNTSAGDGFKGNWFNTSSATTTQMSLGILFRNLATGGSLGNIGSANADNHNTFGPASAYSFFSGGQNKKLFSMCATGSAPQPFIFTNPFVLNNNEVGSAPGICGYAVVSNVSSHYQYNCSNSSYVAVNGFPTAQALDIATDQVPYAEFNEVAEWMDEHALYEQLSEDETLMQNNVILQQFYNDHQNDPTHYIVEENEHIRDLLQDMNGMTLADYQTALDNAETNNALIISTEQHEINERLINGIYIKYLRAGATAFTEAEWQTISDLATQCPYIGGSAVLKARNLYTLINPLVGFEDVTLCNSVGVYKNGNNAFNDENNMLDSLSAAGVNLVDANRLKIYPNPANSEINITYNTQVESQFIIYDITGRVIIETILPAKNAKVSIDVSRISNGVYTYKQSIGERVVNTGKFVKSDN